MASIPSALTPSTSASDRTGSSSDDGNEGDIETTPLILGRVQQKSWKSRDGNIANSRDGVDVRGPVRNSALQRRKPSPNGFAFSLWGPVLWLSNLQHHFGSELLILLFVSQHLMKGFAVAFMGSATQYLYASYQVLGPRMQIFGGVTQLPWAMKPIIGLVSDCFPIFGLNKGPYIVITSIIGVVAMVTLGTTPQYELPIEGVVACLFLAAVQFSTCDLLTEAKYAEKMQAKPQHGPDLMTFVWAGLQVGGLVAVLLIGPILTRSGAKVPFLIAAIPSALIIVPACRNYLQETPRSQEDIQECRRKMLEQKEACFLCLLVFVGTVILTIIGVAFESVQLNAIVAIIVALVMLVAFSLTLKPIIAKVNAFFLIQTSLGFSIGGASFYFFTDGPKQYPEGPHFSMLFFTSVLGGVGAVCSLLGIFSYQQFMKDWTYRRLLMFTNITLSVLSLLDCIILSRLNVRWGIPDNVFVLGASVMQTVVSQWMWMPGVVLMSQLCPKGMEATMYALLAGCHNLGNTIASNCGAYVLLLLGCNPSGADNETHQFDRLWLGSALSTVLPMLTLVLIPWLIPDCRQTDKLLDEDDRDATTGSLWKRLTST